jgi:hypothetical protein
VSFDVFFQPFAAGDAGEGGRKEVLGVLGPYLLPSAAAPRELAYLGGTAEVYGLDDDSMMINHIAGDRIWDLLLEAARAGRWAIMPVGCPVFVFDEEMMNDLPEVLRPSAQVVHSGAEMLAAIRSS